MKNVLILLTFGFISPIAGASPEFGDLQIPAISCAQFYGAPKPRAKVVPRIYRNAFSMGTALAEDLRTELRKDAGIYLRWFTDRHGIHPLQFFAYMERYLAFGPSGVANDQAFLLAQLSDVLLYRHFGLGESLEFLSQAFGFEMRDLQLLMNQPGTPRDGSIHKTTAEQSPRNRPLLLPLRDLPLTGYYAIGRDGRLTHGKDSRPAWLLPPSATPYYEEEDDAAYGERETDPDAAYNEFDEERALDAITEDASRLTWGPLEEDNLSDDED